jgi:NAD(P)-dependent dehydrogenase (short-subunit alcohol dehydrogenase family)
MMASRPAALGADLGGKTIVVVGSRAKLARPLILHLLACGANIVGVDTRDAGDFLGTSGYLHLRCNLTDEHQLLTTVSRMDNPIHGLVYLPRVRTRSVLAETRLSDLSDDFVLLAGAFVVLAANVAPKCAPDASMVALSSTLARRVSPAEGVSYHLGKAALEQAVRYLAVALGDAGIRVNGISPGWTFEDETQFRTAGVSRQALGLVQAAAHPVVTDDIVNAIAFLLSGHSRSLSGAILDASGGLCLREPGSAVEAAIRAYEMDPK